MNRIIKEIFSRVTKFRKPLLIAADFGLFSLSYFTSWFILIRRIHLPDYFEQIFYGYLFFIVIFLVSYWIAGMYDSLWRYAEAYEYFKCMMAVVAATLVYIIVTVVLFRPPLVLARLPVTVYFVSVLLAGGSTLFIRTAYRAFRSNMATRRASMPRKKVLVVGAGQTGAAVIQGIDRYYGERYDVIIAVDDNPDFRGRRIGKVVVAGKVNDIPKLVEKHGIQMILIAVPHATGKEKRRISSVCAKTDCELKKIPDMFDFESENNLSDGTAMHIEDVSVEDLLGRDVIDIKSLKNKYLAGQTVLVTGAGGTIGSELCRQAAAHGAKVLVMVDIAECGLYQIEQELIFLFGKSITLFSEIANVQDEHRMDQLFTAHQPHLVYHAAAYKHVPLMEHAPFEAVKNNVFGTLNMANVASNHHVRRFVLISSDKAVNPTNVYGATKRVCEMIVQSVNAHSKTEFVAVRFGNVLGSNGSVIPLFKAQIAMGGPVRVTHKDIIRYYMTVSEAVNLVMTAGEMAKGGEIFVLDMGDPVKTLDLAEMLIRLSGYEPYTEIPIEFTGLRPGEKLYEELLMAEEGLGTTSNNKIFVGKPIDVQPEYLFESVKKLRDLLDQGNRADMISLLKEIVPGFVDAEAINV